VEKTKAGKSKAALLKEVEALTAKCAAQEAIIAELRIKVNDQQFLFLKSLKETNQLAQSRLDEIENIYKTISVGLCVLDVDGRFLRVNDRLAQMNGVLQVIISAKQLKRSHLPWRTR
jgi:transcriptional regulator with PAS, ATPase and Fis domain